MPHRIFIDGCAVNRFALVNVRPARALAGSPFTLAVTPDLEAEYTRALDHLFVPSYVKAVLREILAVCERIPVPENWPPSTDRQLAYLARAALVVTDDAGLARHAAPGDCLGLIAWSDVEAHLRTDGRLDDLLRERAAGLAAQA